MNARAVALLGLLQTGFFLGGWFYISLWVRLSNSHGGPVGPNAAWLYAHGQWLLLLPVAWTFMAASGAKHCGGFCRILLICSAPVLGILFVLICIHATTQGHLLTVSEP